MAGQIDDTIISAIGHLRDVLRRKGSGRAVQLVLNPNAYTALHCELSDLVVIKRHDASTPMKVYGIEVIKYEPQ